MLVSQVWIWHISWLFSPRIFYLWVNCSFKIGKNGKNILSKQNHINLYWWHKLSNCLIFWFWHLFANCVSRCALNLSKATQFPDFLLSPYQILRWKLFCPLESPCIELHFTEIGLCAIKAQPRTAGGGWHFDWDILPLITCKFQRGDMNWADRLYFLLSLPFRSFLPLCYSTYDAIYYIMASVCIQWLRRCFNKGTSLSVLWAGLSA